MPRSWKSPLKRVICQGVPVPGVVRPFIRALYAGGVAVAEFWPFVKKLVWIEPVLRSVCEEVGTGLRAERLPYMRGAGRLSLGNNVYLSGRSCFYFMRGMPEPPRIEVGDRTFIGNGCTLSAAGEIRIGHHCLISALVRIHDNDGHPLDAARRAADDPIGPGEVSPVIIGDNVWIGAQAIVLKGVTIGQNSIVGTGAVVTEDVAPNTVVAGNPARVVRSP